MLYIYQKKMILKDLLTKEEFEPKRINQKFANAANRIKYYNNKANRLRHSAAYINKPLLNNLRILNGLFEKKGELTFHIQYLKGKGFSFGVHTHYQELDGKKYVAIYDYVILPLEKEQIKIVKI